MINVRWDISAALHIHTIVLIQFLDRQVFVQWGLGQFDHWFSNENCLVYLVYTRERWWGTVYDFANGCEWQVLWDLKIVHHRIVLQLVTGLQLHGVHSKTTWVYIPNRAEIVRKYEMSKYGKFEIPTGIWTAVDITGSEDLETHILQMNPYWQW